MSTDSIISKVWGFCTTLRDDGVGYDDYLEQLTYLIFLKMADEYSRLPHEHPTTRSSENQCVPTTSLTSSPAITQPIATPARKPGTLRKTPKAAGGNSVTKKS